MRSARRAAVAAALLSGVSFSATAHAQEAEAYRWTGVYLGAGGGYGAVVHTIGAGVYDYTAGGLFQVGGLGGPIEGFDVYSIGNSLDMGGAGAIGTIEGGFDLQLGSRVVLGLVGDYTFSGINSNISAWGDVCYEPDDCDVPTVSDRPEVAFDFHTGNSWTVGARFGVLTGPRTLLYGLAGYTRTAVYGVASLNSIPSGEIAEPTNVAHVGGFSFGAGIETLLSEKLSAKLEYRGTVWSLDGDTGPVSGFFAFADSYVQTIRATLALRLGSGDAALPADGFDGEGYRWTGVHVGAGAGYGTVGYTLGLLAYDYDLGGLFQLGGASGLDVYSIGNSIDFGGRGALATVEGGFDLQFGEHFVVGLIGDYTFSSINSNASLYGEICYETPGPDDCDVPTVSDEAVLAFDFTTRGSWSMGARAGLTAGERTLIYGLGAYTRQSMVAIASIDSEATGYQATASDPIVVSGFTFGAGIETLLGPHLSAKIEYRGTYWAVGGQSPDPVQGFGAFAESLQQSVRGTLSLRFGGGN